MVLQMTDLTRRHLLRLCGAAGLSSALGKPARAGQRAAPPIPTNLRLVGPARAYFDTLAARPDCVSSMSMQSSAEVDGTPPHNFPYDAKQQRKRPVVHDPVMNAAMVTIHAPESTDSQQKHWPIRMPPGHDMFLMWDFRFDANWAWREEGNIVRHKAFQLNGRNAASWFTIRTFYTPVPPPNVAEIAICSNSTNFLYPGKSFRGSREFVEPRRPNADFFIPPNTWGRIAFHFRDIGPASAVTDVDFPNGKSIAEHWPEGRVVEMSSWLSHERLGPLQVHDNLRVLQPYASGLTMSQLEFDTGADRATNPNVMHGWQRYLICLLDPKGDVATIVGRPMA